MIVRLRPSVLLDLDLASVHASPWSIAQGRLAPLCAPDLVATSDRLDAPTVAGLEG